MTDIVEACPNRVEEPKGDNYRKCLCGGYFYYEPKRGRPPIACPWYKKAQPTLKEQERKEKQLTKEKVANGLTPVPILETITDISDINKGTTVYSWNAALFSQDVSRRLYAREYKVVDVNQDTQMLTLVRTGKNAHKNEIVAPVERLRIKTGIEYLNVATYDDVEEEEEVDG